MAGRKKTILDEVEAIESAVAAELTESNNLNKPRKTTKSAKVEETEKTPEAEKPAKAKKSTETEKTDNTEKTVKSKKSTKTAKTEKDTDSEKAVKSAKAEKTSKTKAADKAEKTVKSTKTSKPKKLPDTKEISEPEITDTVDMVVPVDNIEVLDDIVEYIQPSSLEALKARYAEAEEDEQIRNEGFELVKKSGLVRRSRPEETSFEYYSAPASKDDIRTDVDSSLSEVFDSTKSEFDADTVSFEDIASDKKPQPAVTPPVSQEAIRTTGNRYGYDTHTTVIYVDESADDGIQRNTEDELTSAFVSDNKHKRRIFPWLRKRK